MTVSPLESQLPKVVPAPRLGRTFSRIFWLCGAPSLGGALSLCGALWLCGALALSACAPSNEDFFDPSITSDPLVPLPMSSAGAGGSLSNTSDPPPVGAGAGPAVGSAGSSAIGGVSMPRPPASLPDAGGNAPDPAQADAGVAPEAPPKVSDGSCGDQCVRAGGLCSKGTCFFDCSAPGSCDDGQILCPPGVPCDVSCGDNACTDNVLCNVDTTCNIRCTGERSCRREIICEGHCDVTCSGARSCPGGIGGAAQLLDLKCTGSESCGSTVQCEGEECRVACSGPQSCDRVRIFAARNTLVCTGQRSCDSDVSCNGNSCNVQCGANACRDDVQCDALNCTINRMDVAGG